MPNAYDEDLFEDTKMSFGEHLEELRAALIKSVIALTVGVLVGLYFGKYVVQWMQEPLKGALERYYDTKEIARFHARLQERLAAGEVLPPELKRIAELPGEEAKNAIHEVMGQDRMIPQEALVEPGQVIKELKRYDPERFREWQVPANEGSYRKEDMIHVYFWHPLKDDDRIRVTTLSAQEAFMIWMKASLVAGVVIASPAIFYFLWEFVAAGLYPHEKNYVRIFGPISLGLFLSGAALAFFFVFQYVLDFLFDINEWLQIDPDPRISEWMGFALLMPLGFGASFQLPLVMLFLERIGIFTLDTYLRNWRISVLAIAVIAMVLTPAEPVSMLMMTVPLVALYFVGIGFCKYKPKRSGPFHNPIVD